MAEAVVRNVRINDEVIGHTRPWIALTPGSRRHDLRVKYRPSRMATHH